MKQEGVYVIETATYSKLPVFKDVNLNYETLSLTLCKARQVYGFKLLGPIL